MYRNIAIAGATVVAIAGIGTAALAASGSDSTSGSGTASTAHKGSQHGSHSGKHKHGARALLRHVVHGSVVTKGKDGYITHSAVRGTVSSVSATSITVKASDGFTETFSVGKDTKVRHVSGTKGNRKATASTIGQVKRGEAVAVRGKASETSHAAPSATVVVDGIKLTK